MALSNVTLLNTFFEWLTRTNQSLLVINDVSEGFFRKTSGTIQIDNPTFANSNVSLNVSNGYIRANGAGLSFLPNTALQGTIKSSQLQNSTITIISNLGGFTTGSVPLGNTVTMNLNISTAVSDQGTTNVASANVVNVVHELTRAAFAVANTGGTGSAAAFDKANAANSYADSANGTAAAAFTKANNANITAVAAFDKANTGLANTTGVFSGSLTLTTNVSATNVVARTAFVFPNGNTITNYTVSTSAPSGGNNGDIWFQI